MVAAVPSTAVGVGLIVIDRLTDYFTGTLSPRQGNSRQHIWRPGHDHPLRLGLGVWSAVWSVVVIAATIVAAILIYTNIPVAQFTSDRFSPEFIQFTFVLYGIAMTGIGMLTLTGNNVAHGLFGPISDNATASVRWRAGAKSAPDHGRSGSVGNTTKAITKGIAIGSAVIAAVSLFGSFITDVSLVNPEALASGIRVSQPLVFVGMLLGGALPWMFFPSLAIRAVSRAAGQMVDEVRRQFRIPGILEGTRKPDYARAVTISTIAAQRI